MNRVAIVDYGLCNLDSVARAVSECGGHPVVTSSRADLETSNRIILPGVGAFREAIRHLRSGGLEDVLNEQVIQNGIPFLGICLGMQLMATTGLEVEETPGLGWIPGCVRRLLPTARDPRVPHVGWNQVTPSRSSALFEGLPTGSDFYFVHSYHLVPVHAEHILAVTPYGGGVVSAVQRDWIWGVQFHPEKSLQAGFQLLRNFLRL